MIKLHNYYKLYARHYLLIEQYDIFTAYISLFSSPYHIGTEKT
jgi:hypothetical protein